MVNPQISFHGLPPSAAIEDAVLKKVQHLEKFYDRLVSCRVAIESPHRHHHRGRHYRVRVDLTFPGGEIVAGREPDEAAAHTDVYVAIRDAFQAAQRSLRDYSRRVRGVPKSRALAAHGRVTKLFGAEGYGFLVTPDQREVFFDQRSVLNGGFKRLAIGDEVRFVEEAGEMGPQASSLTPVGREGHHQVPKIESRP